MSETEHSQSNIAAMRTQLDNIERMTRLAIASNPHSQVHIEELFARRVGSPELYLAMENGPKTQDELIVATRKSQATVSKICNHLYETGLIERLPESGRVLWMWHSMERTLGISRVARRLAGSRTPPKTGTAQQDPSDLRTD